MKIYIYIMVAGIVSTLVRVLPTLLIKRKINNQFVQSFLYYLPYITLAVMTFPAIINSTEYMISGIVAMLVGIILSWMGGNLFVVAAATCTAVFISEFVCKLL